MAPVQNTQALVLSAGCRYGMSREGRVAHRAALVDERRIRIFATEPGQDQHAGCQPDHTGELLPSVAAPDAQELPKTAHHRLSEGIVALSGMPPAVPCALAYRSGS